MIMGIKESDRIVKTSVSQDTYFLLLDLAKKDGTSLSNKLRHMLTEHLEIIEDRYLARLADERSRTWDDTKALSLDEVRKLLKGKNSRRLEKHK
jgi:predicted DNA-binding protein